MTKIVKAYAIDEATNKELVDQPMVDVELSDAVSVLVSNGLTLSLTVLTISVARLQSLLVKQLTCLVATLAVKNTAFLYVL